jgi:hypothetical protein
VPQPFVNLLMRAFLQYRTIILRTAIAVGPFPAERERRYQAELLEHVAGQHGAAQPDQARIRPTAPLD